MFCSACIWLTKVHNMIWEHMNYGEVNATCIWPCYLNPIRAYQFPFRQLSVWIAAIQLGWSGICVSVLKDCIGFHCLVLPVPGPQFPKVIMGIKFAMASKRQWCFNNVSLMVATHSSFASNIWFHALDIVLLVSEIRIITNFQQWKCSVKYDKLGCRLQTFWSAEVKLL